MVIYYRDAGNPRGESQRLLHEQSDYQAYREKLSLAASHLKLGMNREQVERTVTEPPDSFSFDDERGRVVWRWYAGTRKGCLMQDTGDLPSKADPTLTVSFAQNGQVEWVDLS